MNRPNDKIFIVDDEERMCNSLASLLRAEGYDVETFQQSEKAAEEIRNRRVDLVLSDIKMPGLSGLDLLKIAAQTDDEIPVILMTGYASLHSAVEAVSLGAYDYLLKPIEFADLALVAKRALEKRRSDLSRRQLMEELKLSNMILNRRINELNALYEAGKSIGSTVHLRDLLKQIVTLASSVTEAQTGSIMLLDDASSSLTIEAAIGLEPEVVEKTVLPVGESIAGFVAETGEPLIVNDVENDERFRRINREKYGSASLLCVPLLIKNKVIGVINMANKEGGAVFSDGDFRLLTTFASQAAVAVDDAYQFERNRRRLLEFEILHEVSREVPNTESVNEFRRKLVDKLQRVFEVDYSIWFRWDAESDNLIPSGVSGETTIPVTSSGGIDLRKISQDHISLGPINLDKINLDEIEQLSMIVTEKLRENDHYVTPGPAFMAVPVKQRGELTNVFCLGSSGGKPYTADDISLAQLVISQSAVLFEKERSLLNTTRLLTMGNMISEISHDLRKPLTSIKGGLQVLRKRWPDQAESSNMFQMAESEIQRLNELVRELVDFSNPNRYQTEKIDLRKLVERATELIRPDMKKVGIEFDVDYDDADWEVAVNKNQIMETILNLLINAVDAMPDGGKLEVRGLIERPDHKKENYLTLRISDTGVGIKKEDLAKVFGRYYTTKKTGTGLGLAVVERIMSAHGGTLTVTSTEGKGAIFSLYFPIST